MTGSKRSIFDGIYGWMFIVAFANILFSVTLFIVTDCNSYAVCRTTLHGTTESIEYTMLDWNKDVVKVNITEDEYVESMQRFGMRHGIEHFNIVPNELIGSDRAVTVIGDRLMGLYSDDYSRANAALRLIQTSICYCSDSELYGVEDFWARPTETLYHMKGDCEDLAILYCSICNYMGISTIILDSGDHEAAAVKVECDGYYYEFNGERYYTTELTTGYPSNVGQYRPDKMDMYDGEPSYVYYLYSLYMYFGQQVEVAIQNLGEMKNGEYSVYVFV